MATTDRNGAIRNNHAAHYPKQRSTLKGGVWELFPLGANPQGFGAPFPTETQTETDVLDFTPAAFADIEAVSFDLNGTTVVQAIDPNYPFDEIEDDFARGLAKLRSCFTKIMYNPIVLISANSGTPANYDLKIILAEGDTVNSIDAAGSTVSAEEE